MALSYQFFTLRTPSTISDFLNLNICFAEIIDPALDAIPTFNIRHAIGIDLFAVVFWLLSKRWIGMNGTNLTYGKIWQHGRSTDFNAQGICSSRDIKKL